MADTTEASTSTTSTNIDSRPPWTRRGRPRRFNNGRVKQTPIDGNDMTSTAENDSSTSAIRDLPQSKGSNNRRGRGNRRGGGAHEQGGNRNGPFNHRNERNVQPNSTGNSFFFNPGAVPFVPCCLPQTPQTSAPTMPPPAPQVSNRVPASQRLPKERPDSITRGSGNRNRGNSRGTNNRRGGRRNTRLNNSEDTVNLGENANKPLRERLIYQLENNQYECAICYQRVTTKQGVWSCKTCYHIFHISNGCIIDWAKSSKDKEDDNKWRCPTCQTKIEKVPYNYYCFCGKQRNPTYHLGEVPHSCGEVCGGTRKHGCPHPCTEHCHPGPCSECLLQVMSACNCGKTKVSTRCGSGGQVICDAVCGKLFSCGKHTCERVCHQGECGECTILVEQKCYCGIESREVLCTATSDGKYCCENECEGIFNCGVHRCDKKCHDKSKGCGECARDVNRIKNCPCGRKTLEILNSVRKKCSDPIPTCQSVCDKILECGSSGRAHRCQSLCHEGECPPCQLNTSTTCRCNGSVKVLPCGEYLNILKSSGEYLCTKRCKKKKSCGLHKCQEVCCIQADHFCMQLCNKRLSCGLHNCDHICHAGQCPRCLQADFDEQFCHCGRTVRLPPIPCGSGLPVCKEKCVRPHECDHPVNHNCHGETNCPPCTFLTSKMCYGNHQIRKNIPCHISAVSCGIKCARPLKCGMHDCTRSCHGDDCEKEGEKCKKKCEKLRDGCEHACSLPCHGDSVCEPSPCRQMVRVTCECGRIKKEQPCWEVEKTLNSKEECLSESSNPESKEGTLKRSSSMTQLNCIKCDDDCKKLERNRKVASALDIDIDENGESKLAPMITFPFYLKDMVKQNIEFVKTIEKVFVGVLEQMSDPTNSQNLMRAHLPPMNLEKRRFIHEYSQYFNIETESVDQPPKRSIMLTAVRGRSHQPMVFISELINYKGALNTPGPSVIKKDMIEDAMRNKSAKGEEEEGMKPLKSTERVVYRREPRQFKQVPAPGPIKQQNMFSLLGSDSDSDEDDETVKVVQKNPVECDSSSKDWWSEDEAKHGDWQEVKPKEWIVEVERVIDQSVPNTVDETPVETEDSENSSENTEKKMEELSVDDKDA